jgi:hypothetical protein
MKCVLIIVCDVHCTSENPLPVSEGVWSMFNTMKTGRYGACLAGATVTKMATLLCISRAAVSKVMTT